MTLVDLEARCSNCGHPRREHRLGMCWTKIGQVIRAWIGSQPQTEPVYCYCSVFQS